jgi:hypothetical protein
MAEFDYVFLRLRAPDQLAALSTVRTEMVQWFAAHRPPTGRVSGLFVPQLGWPCKQLALLIERGEDAAADGTFLENLAALPQVERSEAWRLVPTLRPRPGDTLTAGGMYVHRWFDVRSGDVDEFVELSSEAWSAGLGENFEARPFGLFRERTDQPVQRMLLLTRYGSHADWEGSRVATPYRSQGEWEAAGRPASTARQALTRRSALTLDSVPASTLLVAP